MKLKSLFSITTICAFVALLSMSFTTTNGAAVEYAINTEIADDLGEIATVEYVYVYFENNCGKDVKWEIKYPGHGSSSSISAGKKERKTIQTGGKIYIDGEFFMEIEKGHDGKTMKICG